MGTLRSALKLEDRFTRTIYQSIAAMDQMLDTMDRVNDAGQLPGFRDALEGIRRELGQTGRAVDGFHEKFQNLDDLPGRADRIASGFGGLSQAVVAANQGLDLISRIGSGLDRMGDASESRASADARLGLINDGLRTQEQLEAQVLRVAMDTRSEYGATADLVARMGRQDYFRGNNDAALRFAETLNKGLIVSGASSQEASSALLQLSQGIASGVLRGEEFNSIMENGSVLAEMMASSLGVTKGELRAMAEEGRLTTEVVVGAIMAQAGVIDQQFESMATTYGQAKTALSNVGSELMDSLAQPGMAVDLLTVRLQDLAAWAQTADGTQFLDDLSQAATAVVSGILWVAQAAGSTYQFFRDNWSNIGPIMWGLAAAVGGVTAAYMIYKGVAAATAVVDTIRGAAQAFVTGKTIAETTAQYGLNAALLACPITWIVVAVMALIGVIVAVTLKVMDLWETNIDFRVGVVRVWNEVLGFFDQVPLFFQWVGNGIADGFSYAKVWVLQTLEDMVNGAIDRINRLIELANQIPGVSIDAVGAVTFGAETALEEEAKRAQRAAQLAQGQAEAAARAAQREEQLAEDRIAWQAEMDAKRAAAKGEPPDQSPPPSYREDEFPEFQVSGGTIDQVGKIGKEVDISDQSLEYLHDIAEMRVLEEIESVNTSDLRLSREDAALMRQSAAHSTNIYYIQYTGGVKVKADVQRGDNWEDVVARLEEESQHEIDTGISDLEEVVFG